MGKILDIIKDAYKRMGEVDVPDSEGADYTTFINNVDEKKILAEAMAETTKMEHNIDISNRVSNKRASKTTEHRGNNAVKNAPNKQKRTVVKEEHERE